MKSVVDKMYVLIDKTLQQAYKPAVLVFEAKYYLFYENNRDKATELYNTATVLAEAFGDQVFIKNLKMEIQKDFKYRIENISATTLNIIIFIQYQSKKHLKLNSDASLINFNFFT